MNYAGDAELGKHAARFCSACSSAWPDTPGPHLCPEHPKCKRRIDRTCDDALRAEGAAQERVRLAGALASRAGRVKSGSIALLNAAAALEKGRL